MSDERSDHVPLPGPGGSGRRGWSTGTGLGVALAGAGLLVIAFLVATTLWGDDGAPDGGTATSQGPGRTGRTPVPGYGFGEVALVVVEPDGTRRVLCVMEAATAAQRARGLMEVTDESLGGYDGMLFLYPVDSSGGFWMRNTPMPLSIAYLSAEGEIVSTADMEPCEDRADCRSYPPEGPYRYALEVPQGRLDDLGVIRGASIEVGGDCQPAPD